jgi:ATP/maltotriose-dependent transcriptional regulator MalT/DNA-binding SARP family transcriptional activator
MASWSQLPAPSPALAKLTVPEPSRVVPRLRLFERLDDARRRGNVVWIAAPAGSGKTTLVASYIRERRLRSAWFQTDPADSDVASFLYYLGQIGSAVETLPAFTAEYLTGLPAFARRWFRRFFALVPDLQILVLDDYHQIDAASPVHTALREALAELPPHLAVIVASRSQPPPVLTRLRTLEHFTLIDAEALRLTVQECHEVSHLRLGERTPETAVLHQLHERTQGWLAGLVLMLEGDPAALAVDGNAAVDPLVFDYFAGELLAQCEARLQRFLLRSALLHHLTPDAAARITGMDDAADLLADLDRRNLFVARQRAPREQWCYEYHPLFRQFLLDQGRRRLAADELREAQRLAASLLAEAGDVTGSIALLRETDDWGQVVALVLKQAPEMLRKGRFQTLAGWIGDIPQPMRAGTPWLDLFLGLCRLPFDPMQARQLLASAYDGLRATANPAGEYLAWSGIVDTYIYTWSDFRSADPWIDEFDALRARHPAFPSRDIEMRVATAIFAILMYRRPQDAQLPHWAARVETLLGQDIDPTMRMLAANHLVLYQHWWVGRVAAGNEVLGRVEPFAGAQTVGPFVRIVWHGIAAIANWMSANPAAALDAVEQGLALAEETGAHLWDFMLLGQGAFATLSSGDAQGARSFLRRMQASIQAERHLDNLQYRFACFQEAVQRGDRTAMREHAQAGLDCALGAGVPWGEVYARPALAQALFANGDADAAAAELQAALRLADQIGCSNARYYVHELAAQFAAARGDGAAEIIAVRELFAVMREQGFVNSAWWRDSVMARLCRLALEHGIETDFVRALVQRRTLQPQGPLVRLDRWPWPLRVHTLGGLQIEVDGVPLRFAGKVQKRPLELLKALVAFGAIGVAESQLAEALWPDAEGDEAHNAFVTTLQRLRKLLGRRQALVLQEGRLSLDRQLCLIDTWAFESVDPQAAEDDDLRRALRLYRGEFLAGDDAYWTIAPRERWRARFVRAAGALAERHAAQQRWDDAIASLEDALQVDDKVESFYQQLMTFQARAGRNAEVQVTYRRCRDVLASTLQARPSPSTEALLRRLGAETPGLTT